MPSKHLLEYLENQNINIDNLLTNQDSMVNLDSELEKMESAAAEDVPAVKPVTLDSVNNNSEQPVLQPINLEMPKEQLIQPQVISVVPEVGENIQNITPMNNNGVVNQTPNIPNQAVSEITSSSLPNVATIQSVSPVPEQNIPFPSEVL